MESKTVEYECQGGNGRAVLTVDVAAVTGILDAPLPPTVAALFVAAAECAGVPVAGETYVSVEAWPPRPQPWPVFLAVDGAIVAEFYPVGFSE
jgi:hypothetical protein